jgi:hypothetical protein
MSTPPHGKYQLRTLHEEISLFDRKLAHLMKYETFPTEADRDAAAGKLNSKRNLLVRAARQMAVDGVEFDPSEIPASLRPADADAVTEAVIPDLPSISISQQESSEEPKVHSIQTPPSPYAGTALDCRQEVQTYKRTKTKQKSA